MFLSICNDDSNWSICNLTKNLVPYNWVPYNDTNDDDDTDDDDDDENHDGDDENYDVDQCHSSNVRRAGVKN